MQQKMMLFTPAVGVLYGFWFFLAPNSYWSVMAVPADLISDLASAQLQNTGLALLVIAYVLIATRKYVSLENTSEFMMIAASSSRSRQRTFSASLPTQTASSVNSYASLSMLGMVLNS